MSFSKLLIANRGEIAVRIARAAAELGVRTVAVHARDDAGSLHTRVADESAALAADGPAAYLDADAIVAVARAAGCDAVHPGYGFLSESSVFAQKVLDAGMRFVGPRPELLALFGDKARARALAAQCSVPLLTGTDAATGIEQARDFLSALGEGRSMMIKAIAGGGGRGMRVVHHVDEVEPAYLRCQSEARNAFGNGDLYVERYMPAARHIEIQVLGDGGEAIHLGERECTIQRRNQKVIEIAPSPTLSDGLRAALCEAALRMARKVGYEGLGTFEFLVSAAPGSEADFAFIETNPRLQVEHTVTEEILGIDLVKTQLRVAAGATLADLGLAGALPAPRGHAIQLRINMETTGADGSTRPSGGVLAAFDPPSGPGVRVDTFGYTGYATNPRYDSLLAKLIVHSPSPDYAEAVGRARRALSEFRIEGLATNIPLLDRLLAHPDFVANRVHTRFIDEHLATLLAPDPAPSRERFFRTAAGSPAGARPRSSRQDDPLAVFSDDEPAASAQPSPHVAAAARIDGPEGTLPLLAPLQGTVVALDVAQGDSVRQGQQLLVLEAMKMEHIVAAETSGVVRRIDVSAGDTVFEKAPLVHIEPDDSVGEDSGNAAQLDLDLIRADLAQALERKAAILDAQRPDAVARRRRTGQRTTRENLADLFDPGSFVEYGGLAVAAQRQRRSFEELLSLQPGRRHDRRRGNGQRRRGSARTARAARCSPTTTRCSPARRGCQPPQEGPAASAGASAWGSRLVLFAEGGGGRPGDTADPAAGLDTPDLRAWARSAGSCRPWAIVSGRCFAGNAALLGSCDVIIAPQDSNIGMGGPAMIEGGGLGVFAPEEIGPIDVQVPNGVVDVAVARRGGSRRRREAATSPTSRAGSRSGAAPTSGCCATRSPRTGCAPTTSARLIERSPTWARCWSCGTTSAWAWSRR